MQSWCTGGPATKSEPNSSFLQGQVHLHHRCHGVHGEGGFQSKIRPQKVITLINQFIIAFEHILTTFTLSLIISTFTLLLCLWTGFSWETASKHPGESDFSPHKVSSLLYRLVEKVTVMLVTMCAWWVNLGVTLVTVEKMTVMLVTMYALWVTLGEYLGYSRNDSNVGDNVCLWCW